MSKFPVQSETIAFSSERIAELLTQTITTEHTITPRNSHLHSIQITEFCSPNKTVKNIENGETHERWEIRRCTRSLVGRNVRFETLWPHDLNGSTPWSPSGHARAGSKRNGGSRKSWHEPRHFSVEDCQLVWKIAKEEGVTVATDESWMGLEKGAFNGGTNGRRGLFIVTGADKRIFGNAGKEPPI